MSFNPFKDLLGSRKELSDPGAARSVLIVGLGRFGSALAETLMELGADVLAIDTSPTRVAEWAPELTHVREGDATSAKTLRQLGAAEFDVAVVAIGSDIESSVLATAALLDVGVSNIWAKAVRQDHGRILSRVGAHHVVYPEREMGMRAAHAISGRVIDYFQLDEKFALAEIRPPACVVGQTLADANIRQMHEVTVVAIKRNGGMFSAVAADTVLNADDILAVAGELEKAEKFAAL